MNVIPKIVSGRVVNISNFLSVPSTSNHTEAPSERPIQYLCDSFIDSGQSIVSNPSRSLCAYAVMRMLHCSIFLRSTGKPPRSDSPSFISSLASTVPSPGHQLTSVSERYVRRYFDNISCFSPSENAAHCEAENSGVSSSDAALTPALPCFWNMETSSSIRRARSDVLSYHASYNCKNIHCVHL